MKTRQSIYNIGNDYGQYIHRWVKITPPGPIPPGPIPPGPIPPEDDPIAGVSIKLSISGSLLKMNVTGNLSTLSYYKLYVYEGDELVGTYILEKTDRSFNLNKIDQDYGKGTYTLKAVAFSTLGNNSPASNTIEYKVLDKRSIWIKIKFLDPDYNPMTKQLATGLNCSRGGDIGTMEHQKNYSADWQLVDAENNIWMWGVTEGTDVSHAFATVNGEASTPLLIDTDWLDAIPEIMGPLDGYDRATTIALVESGDWWIVPEEEFTGKVNIIDWDLSKATNTSNMFGGIPWVSNAVYGTLPGFTTNSTNTSQMFSRFYHVTEIGAVELPKSNDNIQTFYSMTSLTKLPELTVKDGSRLTWLFGHNVNVDPADIETTYFYLLGMNPSDHNNTFKNSGIEVDEHALDNIPISWGGNARILGTNFGSSEYALAAGDNILKIYE